MRLTYYEYIHWWFLYYSGFSRRAELIECMHIKKGLTRVAYDRKGLGGPILSVYKLERLRTW